MDQRLIDAVVPLLRKQRLTDEHVSLDECVARARECGVRTDLVVLLVRSELPLKRLREPGMYTNFVVDVANTNMGCIRWGDDEALEALHLVAQALGKTLTIQVIER